MPFRITILGTSGALPAYDRLPSSHFLEINNKFFLVDCGEGTQFQLLKYRANIAQLNHIFISHLHGDHYLGLLGLLFTMHMRGRRKDLHLYSHRGLDEIIINHLRYARSALLFKIIYHELEENVREIIYSDKNLSVESFPLTHKLTCSGFLFREKPKPRRIAKPDIPQGITISQLHALKRGEDIAISGKRYPNEKLTLPPKHARSYAYCSDTAFDPRVTEAVAGVDILYHEATFADEHEDKAIETLHSTAREAGQIAARAGVKKLVIGHFSARYKDVSILQQEAESVFQPVVVAQEGDIIEIDE